MEAAKLLVAPLTPTHTAHAWLPPPPPQQQPQQRQSSLQVAGSSGGQVTLPPAVILQQTMTILLQDPARPGSSSAALGRSGASLGSSSATSTGRGMVPPGCSGSVSAPKQAAKPGSAAGGAGGDDRGTPGGGVWGGGPPPAAAWLHRVADELQWGRDILAAHEGLRAFIGSSTSCGPRPGQLDPAPRRYYKGVTVDRVQWCSMAVG